MKYVRMIDVIRGNNGDGDPIVSYETPEELERLEHFCEHESDGRYMVEDDVSIRTVDEWITNEKEINSELRGLWS
jgi:hypothetical protein